MKVPRVRIGTLMLLVVIAALAGALVVEKRRAAALIAERDRGRQAAELSDYYARLFAARAATLQKVTHAKPKS